MALFSFGFRPFFLLAGLYGALAIPLSLIGYLGYGGEFTTWPAGLWHVHEMVFGYALAVIAGFLLTAVPGWQKAAPVTGAPLALLAAIWVAGRLAMGLSAWLPPMVVAAVDLAFIPALFAIGVPGLLDARAKRNRIFLVILGLFFVANSMLHFDIASDVAVTLAVDLLVLLICVLGGRIVPSFTGPVGVREPEIDSGAIAADDLPEGTLFATATGAGVPWDGHPAIREVSDLLAAWEPDLVIGQPIGNLNLDHYAAAQIVGIAWQVAAQETAIGPYLIPVQPPGIGRSRFPPLKADRLVDVTGYEETCLQALACHRSQGGHLPATQERRRKSWAGWRPQSGFGATEGFAEIYRQEDLTKEERDG